MAGRALITGASSGLGVEFARLAASQGYNLVISARRADRLNALKSELEAAHGIRVTVAQADLTAPGEAEALWATASDNGAGEIDLLVNNAGLGTHGPFGSQSAREEESIALNISAYTTLMRLAATHMTPRGSGGILNVASLAGFMPGPNMAVYHASKAYALSLSDALHDELRNSGVRVTALCPGATKTEFFDAAQVDRTWLMTLLPMGTAKSVSQIGWRALARGKKRVVPGPLNKIIALSSRISPPFVLGPLTKWLLSKNR
ncbi:MAG: SDR family NAD(P)-dependent oxidoreductase [Maritimibacter sp.]